MKIFILAILVLCIALAVEAQWWSKFNFLSYDNTPMQHYANMPVQYTAIFHGCKNDNFQIMFSDIFLIFAQNIYCWYTLEPPQRGGSNEYPQSMFWSKNKKNMYTPVNPTFSI